MLRTIFVSRCARTSPFKVGAVMPETMPFEVQQQGDVTVVHLQESELADTFVDQNFQDELAKLVDSPEPFKLLVQFDDVGQYPTDVISGLLDIHNRVADKGKLKFCGLPSNQVHRACRLLGLNGDVLDIYDSSNAAMAAF